MTRRYKVGYTKDQLRYTPPCGLDFRVPARIAKDVLALNADEVCPDGRLRYGQSKIIIREPGIIEIEGESSENVRKILSLLKGKVEVKET